MAVAAQLHRYGGRDLARRERTWPGVGVDRVRWQVADDVTGLTRRPEHQVFVTLAGSIRRTSAWIDGGSRYDGADFAGAVSFVPSRRYRRASYRDGTIDYAAVRLDPGLVGSFGGVDADRLEFAGFTNQADPLLHRMVLALCEEAESPGVAGRLFVDSVATALLTHLVRTSSELAPRRLPAHAALPGPSLRQVLEYVNDQLGSDLRLAVLAKVAGTDRTTFSRAFKATTGLSPHRYVSRRRLERAAELLRRPGPPIADVAHVVGLSSQSHLTTAFRRVYGTTPAAYRRAHLTR